MKLISNALTIFIIIAVLVICLQGKEKKQAAIDLSERDLACMVQAVYFEARSEDALGQAAVAHVILNRMKSPLYPDSVCKVVWQPAQFSYTEDGKSDRMTDQTAIEKAVDVSLAVIRGKIKDPTGMLHDYDPKFARPAWARGGYKVLVGQHAFVRLAGR